MQQVGRKYITIFQSGVNSIQKKSIYRYLKEINIPTASAISEIEMFSDFVITHRESLKRDSVSTLHSHTFYELTHYNNDCGVEYLVGSYRYHLQKGDVIITPPGISHCTLFPDHMTEACSRDVIWLSAEFTEFIGRRIPDEALGKWNQPYLMRTTGTKWEFLSDMFHAGVREAEAKEFRWDNAVAGNTMLILTHMCRAALDEKNVAIKPEKAEILENVIQYIDENMAGKISTQDTARLFFISESTLNRLFRKKTGNSFYRYVTMRRLAAAKTLIIQGETIESIGEKVGFSDYATFYRAFKQEYGISPRQFRKLGQVGISIECLQA